MTTLNDRRREIATLKREAAALVLAPTHGAYAAGAAELQLRAAILGYRLTVPAWIFEGAAALLIKRGPITHCAGAGLLSVRVEATDDLEPGYRRESSKSWDHVPKAYGYAVTNHTLIYSLPRSMRLLDIEGVLTLISRSDDPRDAACWTPERLTHSGYTARWIRGHVYRGAHGKTKAECVELRRRRVLATRAHRAAHLPVPYSWISPASLARVGACKIGIAAATRRAEVLLHAQGEIGGVLASWAAAQSPEWDRWARVGAA